MPTRNRASLLREAIESVLCQTTPDWELIVVDDGSTDSTAAMVGEYLADARVRYSESPGDGRSAARNHGIDVARGEFIAFLDSDDRYMPTALVDHLDVFATHGRVGMTVGGYRSIDVAGTVTGERRPWTEGGKLALDGWLLNCFGIPGSVLVRREWLARVGGFDERSEATDDWDLFLRLTASGCPAAWTPSIVCEYRHHANNSIRDVRRYRRGATDALDRVFDRDDLTPAVAALEPTARAQVEVTAARRAAAAADDELVRECLLAARKVAAPPSWRRRGRSISPHGFPSLLEPLVADALERGAPADVDDRAPDLPARWGISRGEIRRAAARVELRLFFESRGMGERHRAAAHLRRGLKLDPRWLANRAVVGFLVGRALKP